jgi:hypothetical protein
MFIALCCRRMAKELGLLTAGSVRACQSGGWKTVALYSADGCSQNNDLENGAPRPTEVAM